MKLLGVDYGRAKIGFAQGLTMIAKPLFVVRVKSCEDALAQVKKVVEAGRYEKVIIGVSEGVMGEEQEEFALELSMLLGIPVETSDEGLTTQDAQLMAREAGLKQKKRREMEDAYAATIMLQSYLDKIRNRNEK